MESPLFNESEVKQLGEVPYRAPVLKFQRDETLNKLYPSEKAALSGLLSQIDRMDAIIDFYAYFNGKRAEPPREELLNRFSRDELIELQQRAHDLTPTQWMNFRHELVELRRQQFFFKDSAEPRINTNAYSLVVPEAVSPPQVGTEILTAPLPPRSTLYFKVAFSPRNQLNPFSLCEEEINQFLKAYWAYQDKLRAAKTPIFDFRNEDHLYAAFQAYWELESAPQNYQSQLTPFLAMLDYYREFARLSPIQEKILTLKILRVSNKIIAAQINRDFFKSYNENYISTIFKKKILRDIAAAAREHEEILRNLSFKENFKQCSKCGCIKLRTEQNFTHKARSADGFTGTCKECDAARRKARREEDKALFLGKEKTKINEE